MLGYCSVEVSRCCGGLGAAAGGAEPLPPDTNKPGEGGGEPGCSRASAPGSPHRNTRDNRLVHRLLTRVKLD